MKYDEIPAEYFNRRKLYREVWIRFAQGLLLSPEWKREDYYSSKNIQHTRQIDIEAIKEHAKATGGDEWTPSERIIEFVERYFPDRKTKILDNAGGHGRHSIALAEKGYTEVVLFDHDLYKLNLAKKRVEEKRKRATNADIAIIRGRSQKLPFRDDEVDLVIYDLAMFLQRSLDDIKQIIRESSRVLRKGGCLVGMTQSVRSLEDERNLERFIENYRRSGTAPILASDEQLRMLLSSSGFEVSRIEETFDPAHNNYNLTFVAQAK